VRGVQWIETVLVPCIRRAASSLEPHGATVRLDTNLDSRSTNHAHADFWLATNDGTTHGPKYSVNVIGEEIKLYKTGAPGRSLGKTGAWGPAEVDTLLTSAAEEFGTLLSKIQGAS
jgi:hypothetical protein